MTSYSQTYASGSQYGFVSRAVARTFIVRLFFWALVVRLLVVFLLNITDAIQTLHLSPDSLRYHREGYLIAHQMAAGFFNWPNWIDNGWFQFTGFVYYLFGPHPLIIQLINVTFGALTPVVAYLVALRVFRADRPARTTAILVAFFPSFIYWSCLMLKDPIAILALSSLVLSIVGIRDSIRFGWLLLMVISLLVLMGVRSYLLFVTVFFIAVSYVPVEGRRAGSALVRLILISLMLGWTLYFFGYGFMGVDYIQSSHYFDVDYINATRDNINHGGGAFFSGESAPKWGEDVASTLSALSAAVFFFFVTLDFSNISGARQLMALPEVVLVVLLLPSLLRGLKYSWRYHRQAALPLMVFAFGLLAVYGSATTNMGAMYRWRMQAMPFLVMFMVVGVYVRSRGLFYRLASRLDL